MRIRVLYHDHCFDGAASAAYFSRFIAGAVHPDAEFQYTGMAHKASQMFDSALFDGDENAIVDFKYSSDPRLTWWFDHHQSAFLNAEIRSTSAAIPGPQALRPQLQVPHSFICRVGWSASAFARFDPTTRPLVVIDGAVSDARPPLNSARPP